MNNKFFLVLICLAIITTSCRKELTFETVTTSSNELSICNNATCPEIDIEYVQVSGTTETAQIINESIEDFVKQSMYLGENETGSSAENITQAMTEFVEIYRLHSAEFPDLTAEYFVEITVLPSYNSKELLSLSCRNYLYAGGAHGNGSLQFKNFDPKDGRELYYEDIFDDVAAFEALAENKFRSQQNIPTNTSINATGFRFEDGKFYLPETFGISKEFITLQYNAYEIASYAAGPTVVEIPISEVKELLKIPIKD